MTNSESVSNEHHLSSDTHRRVARSTTLNRKYVRRPSAVRHAEITSTAKKQADALKRRQALAEQINRERLETMRKKAKVAATPAQPVAKKVDSDPIKPAEMHAIQKKAIQNLSEKKPSTIQTASMREQKDLAIKNALASVATMESKERKKPVTSQMKAHRTFSMKKIALALSCAALSVALISYFVSLNMPDVSVRVAAMQTGIEASYPTYIPRGYSLSNISSESEKVVMTFSDSNQNSFSLTEEKSSWNSSALETNYVKKNWDVNYSSIREQGLTIYISNSEAAWVNGGIVYKLTTTGEALTKKQIKSIATSL